MGLLTALSEDLFLPDRSPFEVLSVLPFVRLPVRSRDKLQNVFSPPRLFSDPPIRPDSRRPLILFPASGHALLA